MLWVECNIKRFNCTLSECVCAVLSIWVPVRSVSDASMLAGPLVHRCEEIPVCQSVPDALFICYFHLLLKDTNIQRKNLPLSIWALYISRTATYNSCHYQLICHFFFWLINFWVYETYPAIFYCLLSRWCFLSVLMLVVLHDTLCCCNCSGTKRLSYLKEIVKIVRKNNLRNWNHQIFCILLGNLN